MIILCVVLAFIAGASVIFAIDGLMVRAKYKQVLKESIEDNEKMLKLAEENKQLKKINSQQTELLMRQGYTIQELNDDLFM